MKRQNLLNLLAILSINMTNACGTLENAALQLMMEAWPNMAPSTIRLVVTLPGLVSMFVMSGVGLLVGRKGKFKHTILLGLILILFGGIMPFFIHERWYWIIGCRLIMGLGIGLVSVRTSLLMISVKKEEVTKMIGWAVALGSITSAALSPLVGLLTTKGWYYSFLVNSIALISLVMVVLFLKEPLSLSQPRKKEKSSIPRAMYVFLGLQFVVTMTLYPLLSGLSTYLVEMNLGDASIAGWLLSLYTGAGIISSLLLKQMQEHLSYYLLSFCLLLCVVGLGFVLIIPQLWSLCIGIFLSGFGFIAYVSSVQIYAGKFCSQATLVKVSPWLLGMTQLGVFLSSYFMDLTSCLKLFSSSMKHPYLMGLIINFIISWYLFLKRKSFYPYHKED